ncbi:Aminoglycoside 3'-phosphotransferase-2 OS=Ureibacillus acetophenoni OX=614649 GN=SAMN05877842_106128 PE=4 SV=1 [Ureibacillus acetophenoni]|uniref:aminoglycoside phosphotransferase family protein n=1 Tax=Ureibacillus sp. MALMAid1270 TaxID=3411629 RepID=UPI003BA5169D
MDSSLLKKLEEMLGEVKDISLLDEQGWTSEVRKITTTKGTYLMKSAFSERYREWLKNEAVVLKKLKNKHIIPVPQYYNYIEEQDRNHVIMSFENGISLTSALKQADYEEKQLLIKSFGQLLNRLHETDPIEELCKSDNWLEYQLNKAELYLKIGDVDGTVELLNKLKNTIPKSVKQTLIHGDCTTDNVLVIDGKVRLFIDVAGMTVGDPRYDVSLAIRKLRKDEEFIKAFYSGYTRYKVSIEEYEYFNEGLYEFF